MSYFFEGIFNDGFHRFRKALITGVATARLERVRIRKEVTRAKVDDHDPLAEYFGFTKEEIITLMSRNGRHRGNQGTYRALVRSFGGYGFRDFNVTLFNPSGVIRYEFDRSYKVAIKNLAYIGKIWLYTVPHADYLCHVFCSVTLGRKKSRLKGCSGSRPKIEFHRFKAIPHGGGTRMEVMILSGEISNRIDSVTIKTYTLDRKRPLN